MACLGAAARSSSACCSSRPAPPARRPLGPGSTTASAEAAASTNASRRGLLATLPCLLAAAAAVPAARAGGGAEGAAAKLAVLQRSAAQAFSQRDFGTAVAALNQLVTLEPEEPRWREMRAQALVDGKDFPAAIDDFDRAVKLTPEGAQLDRARLLAGRALAWEGLGEWPAARRDYDAALAAAEAAGAEPDPYVLNSRGNSRASLGAHTAAMHHAAVVHLVGEWKQARADYLASAAGFSTSRLRDAAGRQTPRLAGAVFAASNAALMAAQLGDDDAALKEMQAISRRAPGSVDMRAALAAMYWAEGREAEAEAEWDFACNDIAVGCRLYTDPDWLLRIRRWPPAMVERLDQFLRLRSAARRGGGGAAALQRARSAGVAPLGP